MQKCFPLPRHIALSIALAAAPVAALADDAEGRFAIDGPGAMPCTVFMDLDRGHPGVRDVAAWMSGYFTALNRHSDDTFDFTPWQSQSTLLGLMRQYCEQSPDSVLEAGANAILLYLGPRRLTRFDERVRQGPEGDQVAHYNATIRAAVAHLRDQGIEVVETEEGLIDALRTFQTAEGLEPSGVLDQATLGRMFP